MNCSDRANFRAGEDLVCGMVTTHCSYQIYSERKQVWKPGSMAKEDVGAYLRLKTVGSNPVEALLCQKPLSPLEQREPQQRIPATEGLSNPQPRSLGNRGSKGTDCKT